MAKTRIDPALLDIDPRDPRAAELARERFWSVCQRCGGAHASWPAAGTKRSTQGSGCSAMVDLDGARAQGHYGSGFDMVVFAVEPGKREELAGLDPVCDACLSELALRADAFPLDWWLGAWDPGEPPETPPEAGASERSRAELAAALERKAAERGR